MKISFIYNLKSLNFCWPLSSVHLKETVKLDVSMRLLQINEYGGQVK